MRWINDRSNSSLNKTILSNAQTLFTTVLTIIHAVLHQVTFFCFFELLLREKFFSHHNRMLFVFNKALLKDEIVQFKGRLCIYSRKFCILWGDYKIFIIFNSFFDILDDTSFGCCPSAGAICCSDGINWSVLHCSI